MVKRYHVEFDVETDDPFSPSRGAKGQLVGASDLEGGDLFIPADAVITEVEPPLEAGWYMNIAREQDAVLFWDLEEIEEAGVEYFRQNYRRMKDPEAWDA